MDKKLFEEYIKYFGDDPPYPPEHIMETLVEMKKNNTYDKTMEKFKDSNMLDKLRKELKDKTGQDLTLDHPFFKINYRKKDKED